MIAEQFKIVPIGDYEDMSSDFSFDSINMGNFLRATLILQFHALGTASNVLTVYSGAADGGLDSALTVRYAWGGAAQGTATAGSATSCDVLTAWTSAASITVTYGTYPNFTLVIDVERAAMDSANYEEWLTVRNVRTGSATGRVSAVAILTPRYADDVSRTCLA